jgi:hypothetical protein
MRRELCCGCVGGEGDAVLKGCDRMCRASLKIWEREGGQHLWSRGSESLEEFLVDKEEWVSEHACMVGK